MCWGEGAQREALAPAQATHVPLMTFDTMTGQQITRLTDAMGELILDTTSKSNIRKLVMEQQVYQLLLVMALDEKQFLHFKQFGVSWRIGLGEQKPCRSALSAVITLQLKLKWL